MTERHDTGASWSAWAWAAVGFAGSLLIALAAPHALHDHVVGWWYTARFTGRAATALIYVGMAALVIAWLGLGRRLPRRRTLLWIATAWLAPLAVAPPLFSRDLYSYFAQGTILHLGVNPYHHAPVVLGGLGHAHVLAAVSPFWRHTTAPYGPLFLELVSGIVGLVGSHLVAGVLLCRALELVGVALIARCTPRLARSLGTDGDRALWLTVASPLVALQLIAAGHNDALMAGLLVAALTVALQGRPLTAVAICALAATIKLPALVGAVFIAVAWARAEREGDARIRLLAGAAVTSVAVIGVITALSGVGFGWLSTSLFATPAKVRLAITPATGVGYTAAAVAHAVGIGVSARGLEATLATIAFALAAAVGAWLLWRVRIGRLVALLGGALLLAAAAGPAAWPWYFSWGLVLVGGLAAWQRSWAVAAAITVGAVLVRPSGQLALPLGSAPVVLAAYVIAGAAWWQLHRRRRGPAAGHARSESGAPPALAGT